MKGHVRISFHDAWAVDAGNVPPLTGPAAIKLFDRKPAWQKKPPKFRPVHDPEAVTMGPWAP